MKKILIFRHASLGDFIVGIPAITMIRKKFLNHKIYFLSGIFLRNIINIAPIIPIIVKTGKVIS